MKGFFEEWRAEALRILKDPGILLLFFGVQLIYPAVYPLPYRAEVLRNVPIAIVDQDRTPVSRQLTRMVDASETVQVAGHFPDFEAARKAFIQREVSGILIIPPDFTPNIRKGRTATLPLYCDGSYFLVYRQVAMGVQQSAGTLSAGIEIQRLTATGLTKKQAMAARDPLPLINVFLFNPAGGYGAYIVPAVLVLILHQTLLIGIGMLGGTQREYGDKTAIPENSSATGRTLGRIFVYFPLYCLHIVWFFGILFRIYRYPQRADLWELFFFLVPFLLATICLGLCLRHLFRERASAMMALLFTSIPILFLSGFSWPVEAIPEPLRILSQFLPATPGIGGFLKLNHMGADFYTIKPEFIQLWLQALIYFILACIISWRENFQQIKDNRVP
ncbi:ABC-2 type transport system permease protein [Desulfobotulus alkaliphilus]|uniref:ABC-2 type transport system permease protein n=1 Tax=Desulfobotulus alkaliphilus TaxID=622671 RepID=A0A562S824_9BACT|nr:ABC transporter permease [Desulfobotulus alkaliphilus]TWI77333.1 ABC-2 type transport system permease protein [Desulfobotulus alkaliphilus]